MSQISTLFCWVSLIIGHVLCNDVINDVVYDDMEIVPTTEPELKEDLEINPDIETMIVKFRNLAISVDKLNNAKVYSREEVEKLYKDMIEIIDELNKYVNNPMNAYKFLKARGIDRIAAPNLRTDHDELKTRLLILLKILFNVAPTTTSAVIPITVVDKLLNIFENDNLALKAHSLDVLSLWLPDNPKVQARVMKVKGLQPFYEQMADLDTNVIRMLLDLFNKILNEHVKARSDVQRTIVDAEKLKFYNRIGLLEQVSSPMVCNGLLDIFVKTWSYNNDDNNVLMTVFELLKNVKQFCLTMFKGKNMAVKLFIALQKYVEEPENVKNFVQNGLNVTDVALVIKDYVDNVRVPVKDEF